MVTKLEEQITQRVIKAREDADLSRKEVARLIHLEEQSYGHYERGRYAFTIDQLLKLSPILGRSVSWFLGIDAGLTEEEDQLIILWKNAGELQRDMAIQALKLKNVEK